MAATVRCLWSRELWDQREALTLPFGLTVVDSRPGRDPGTVIVRMRDEAADPGWEDQAAVYEFTGHSDGSTTYMRTLAPAAEAARWAP